MHGVYLVIQCSVLCMNSCALFLLIFGAFRDVAFQDVGFQNTIFKAPAPMSALGVKSSHLQFLRVNQLLC